MTEEDNALGLLEGIATTRAIRRFTAEPIPDDALATMLFAATRAPSGSNRQPFRFLVLRDPPRARQARRLIGEGACRAWGTKREADRYDTGSGTVATSPKTLAGDHHDAVRRGLRTHPGRRVALPLVIPRPDAH